MTCFQNRSQQWFSTQIDWDIDFNKVNVPSQAPSVCVLSLTPLYINRLCAAYLSRKSGVYILQGYTQSIHMNNAVRKNTIDAIYLNTSLTSKYTFLLPQPTSVFNLHELGYNGRDLNTQTSLIRCKFHHTADVPRFSPWIFSHDICLHLNRWTLVWPLWAFWDFKSKIIYNQPYDTLLQRRC